MKLGSVPVAGDGVWISARTPVTGSTRNTVTVLELTLAAYRNWPLGCIVSACGAFPVGKVLVGVILVKAPLAPIVKTSTALTYETYANLLAGSTATAAA